MEQNGRHIQYFYLFLSTENQMLQLTHSKILSEFAYIYFQLLHNLLADIHKMYQMPTKTIWLAYIIELTANIAWSLVSFQEHL